MIEYVLGIDLGTSGVKAGLLNLVTLKLEFISERSYLDGSEQDPDLLWGKTVDAVKEVVRLMGRSGIVRAVGLTGQMHGTVLYDVNDHLLGPLINWKDRNWSSEDVLERIKLIMGDNNYDELGTKIASGYSAAILMGMKENDPDFFKRIAHFVLPVDFLRGKFLEKPGYATDPTNAFGTGLFNTKFNRWHSELIKKLSLPFNIFPEVHSTHQSAGVISDQVADKVGLGRNVPIIFGGGDNQMSMLGSGLVGPNSPILINIGTAAQISKVVSKFRKSPGMDTRSYFQDNFALVGASLAGGGSYGCLREILREQVRNLEYSQMDKLASTAPPGSDGLVYCSGPTRQDPLRREGFFGNIDKISSIPHQTRAVLEGVLMDLFGYYKNLSDVDQDTFLVGAGKGNQNSRIWPQIAADLFRKPIRITAFENAVYGAALMAGLLTGHYENLDEPVQSIEYTREIIPEFDNLKFYRDEFVNYWREVVGSSSSYNHEGE